MRPLSSDGTRRHLAGTERRLALAALPDLDESLGRAEERIEIAIRQADLPQVGDEVGQQPDVRKAVAVEVVHLLTRHLPAEAAEAGDLERVRHLVRGPPLREPLRQVAAARVTTEARAHVPGDAVEVAAKGDR